ncbi:hypothetical protein B0H13DRAFT_1903533 [Mycena leptocephala]|nr:hypothetical protein B0H13DRAFT_1903533 [Mycena leptocephala]
MVDFAASTLGDKRFRACPMILSQEYSPLPVCWRVFIIRGHHHKAWIIDEDIHVSVPHALRQLRRTTARRDLHASRKCTKNERSSLSRTGRWVSFGDHLALEGHGVRVHLVIQPVEQFQWPSGPVAWEKNTGSQWSCLSDESSNASGTWAYPARVWDIKVFDVGTRKDDSVSVRYGESCGHYIAHAAQQGIRFRASDMCENPHVASRDPIDGGRVNDKRMIQRRLHPERDYETGIANSEMPSSPDACQLAAHSGHQIWAKSLDANNAAFFMPPHRVATAVAQFVPQLSIEPQTLNRSSACLLRRLRRPELRLPSGRGLCWACAKFSTFVTARLPTQTGFTPSSLFYWLGATYVTEEKTYAGIGNISSIKGRRWRMKSAHWIGCLSSVFTHVRDVDISGSYDSYGVYLYARAIARSKNNQTFSLPYPWPEDSQLLPASLILIDLYYTRTPIYRPFIPGVSSMVHSVISFLVFPLWVD